MARLSPLTVTLAAGLVSAGFVVGFALAPGTPDRPEAPPVALEELPGEAIFDDAALRSGQVTLVNYWASWCVPCRAEHPNLMTLAEAGVPIYGVNYMDAPADAAAFISELGNPYAGVGRDPEGRMGRDWGVPGLPVTFVVAGDGTLLTRIDGPVTRRVFNAQLAPYLPGGEGLLSD